MKITLEINFPSLTEDTKEAMQVIEQFASMSGLSNLSSIFGADSVGLVSVSFSNDSKDQ